MVNRKDFRPNVSTYKMSSKDRQTIRDRVGRTTTRSGVIQDFLDGKSSKTSNKSLSSDGKTLKSYNTAIAVKQSDGTIVLNKTKYSSTTSTQQNELEREMKNRGVKYDVTGGKERGYEGEDFSTQRKTESKEFTTEKDAQEYAKNNLPKGSEYNIGKSGNKYSINVEYLSKGQDFSTDDGKTFKTKADAQAHADTLKQPSFVYDRQIADEKKASKEYSELAKKNPADSKKLTEISKEESTHAKELKELEKKKTYVEPSEIKVDEKLSVEKNFRNGYTISDDRGHKETYYGYSLKESKRRFNKEYGHVATATERHKDPYLSADSIVIDKDSQKPSEKKKDVFRYNEKDSDMDRIRMERKTIATIREDKGNPESLPIGHSKIEKVMHEYKKGELKTSSGKKVKSRKQAVAIALSEQRKAEEKSYHGHTYKVEKDSDGDYAVYVDGKFTRTMSTPDNAKNYAQIYIIRQEKEKFRKQNRESYRQEQKSLRESKSRPTGRLTLSEIKSRNTSAGQYFFSPSTMRMYRQVNAKYKTRYDKATDTNYVIVNMKTYPESTTRKNVVYKYNKENGHLDIQD